jgi:hypothetical protein
LETSKQISVFFENRPGRLAQVLSNLAREKVNLIALTVMDSHEHSVLRFVADDLDRARRAMKALKIPITEAEVLAVELRNQPGALAHVCELLAQDHVNIDYAYASAGGRNGKTYGIFKVSNTEKSMRLLSGTNSVGRRRMGRRPIHTRDAKAPSI